MGWPTTSNPRTEFVTLRLTVAEAADLDALAASQGIDRSGAIRDAVRRVVAAEQKRQAKQKKAGTLSSALTGTDDAP